MRFLILSTRTQAKLQVKLLRFTNISVLITCCQPWGENQRLIKRRHQSRFPKPLVCSPSLSTYYLRTNNNFSGAWNSCFDSVLEHYCLWVFSTTRDFIKKTTTHMKMSRGWLQDTFQWKDNHSKDMRGLLLLWGRHGINPLEESAYVRVSNP